MHKKVKIINTTKNLPEMMKCETNLVGVRGYTGPDV